jgi:hypothetical protein
MSDLGWVLPDFLCSRVDFFPAELADLFHSLRIIERSGCERQSDAFRESRFQCVDLGRTDRKSIHTIPSHITDVLITADETFESKSYFWAMCIFIMLSVCTMQRNMGIQSKGFEGTLSIRTYDGYDGMEQNLVERLGHFLIRVFFPPHAQSGQRLLIWDA